MNAPIVLNSITIRTNADGLYRLNDIHAGSPVADLKHKSPSKWADGAGVEVIAAAEAQDPYKGLGTKSTTYAVIHGGNEQGTYASKDLVYAYAMWLSPEFMLHVIHVFDAAVNGGMAPQFDNPANAMIFQMLLAHEQTERELRAHEKELIAVGRRVVALEGTRKEFVSIMGWCNLNDREVSREQAAAMGRDASRRCRQLAVEPGKVQHPAFGEVNTYPVGLLDELFG